MAPNVFASNGWDIIAAASQDSLNAQLSKLPVVPYKGIITESLFGNDIVIDLDITLGPPQVSVKDGSGRQVDILLPLSGTILANGSPVPIPAGEVVVVTTQLLQIEAELQHPDPNQTSYDLVIDFESKDALVSMDLQIPAFELAVIVQALTTIVQREIGTGAAYKLASFALPDQVKSYSALVPYVADFSFVRDAAAAGRSNLLVLMQSVTQGGGSVYFNAPLLPPGEDFMVLVSNRLFLEHVIMPEMVANIQGKARKPADVPGQFAARRIGQTELYEVANASDIPLDEDHDPWISAMTASIDTSAAALCLYLDAKADITFLKIHVDTWDRSWQQFRIDGGGGISLAQIKEEKNKSENMDWWEWLLAVLLGILTLIIVGIINGIVADKAPDVGGTFATLGADVVQWPNQKLVKLKSITTPNHVVLTLGVDFSG